MAEKFVNVHNPYNEIELGDDQALLEAARNATYVINTIPGHAADNVADALANAGTEPFSGLLLDVIYDPRPTKLMEAGALMAVTPSAAKKCCCTKLSYRYC